MRTSTRMAGNLVLSGDDSANFEEIAQFSRHDAENYTRWIDFNVRVSRILQPYVMKPPVSLARIFEDYRSTEDEELLTRLVTTSIGEILSDFFESDEIIAAMWNPVDLGSLWETGSGLGFALSRAVGMREVEGITRLGGVVVGGIGEITRLLAQAAEEHEIRTNSPVQRILVEGGVVRGVELTNGDQISSRAVMSKRRSQANVFSVLVDEEDLDPSFLRKIGRLKALYGSMKFMCTLSELPEFYATRDFDTKENRFRLDQSAGRPPITANLPGRTCCVTGCHVRLSWRFRTLLFLIRSALRPVSTRDRGISNMRPMSSRMAPGRNGARRWSSGFLT